MIENLESLCRLTDLERQMSGLRGPTYVSVLSSLGISAGTHRASFDEAGMMSQWIEY
jgi:hypothetical protein